MLVEKATAEFTDVTFENNYANAGRSQGGAVGLFYAQARFTRCLFSANEAVRRMPTAPYHIRLPACRAPSQALLRGKPELVGVGTNPSRSVTSSSVYFTFFGNQNSQTPHLHTAHIFTAVTFVGNIILP